MLAEARRKIRYSSDPRNTNWTNDDSKFGQKLMEKMGWSKGRGLGANEDGNPLSIAVSLKNDNRGVGWNKKQDDNWIAHQDDFNDLLSSLNAHNGTAGNSSDEDQSCKVQKLEHTSRTSKGRVHYQKFTKGKDLSLRSKNDLDCVFGKRKSKKKKLETEETAEQIEADNESKKETVEESGRLITVTSTDSVQDYFAKKMAAFKNKQNGSSNNTAAGSRGTEEVPESCELDTKCDEQGDETVKVTKKKKKKRKYKDDVNDNLSDATEQKDKDSKISFSVGDEHAESEEGNTASFISNGVETVSNKVKRNKKGLRVTFCLENDDNLEDLNSSAENKDVLGSDTVDVVQTDNGLSKKKKKKSKKRKLETDEAVIKGIDAKEEESGETDNKNHKNKKKRKNKEPCDEVVKKKLKCDSELMGEEIDGDVSEDSSEKKKKSKKKKKMELKETSKDSNEETKADKPSMEAVKLSTDIVNPFPASNPEKVLMEFTSAVSEDILFVMKKEGAEHRPVFQMHVEIGTRKFPPVQCSTKKEAKRKAAILTVIALSEEGKLESLGLYAPVSNVKEGSINTIDSNAATEEHTQAGETGFEGTSLNTLKGYPGLKLQSSKRR